MLMPDRADLTLLGLVAIVSMGSYASAWLTLRRDSRKVQKYKFYKVRDDLIYLVASGEIKESDPVFQYFYYAITFFIKHIQVLTLHSFVEALNEARASGLDPAGDQQLEMLRQQLPTKSPMAQRVVGEFYEAVLETLLENSFLLRTAVKHTWLATVGKELRDLISAIAQAGQIRLQAYVFYRSYEHAASTTSHNGFQAA